MTDSEIVNRPGEERTDSRLLGLHLRGTPPLPPLPAAFGRHSRTFAVFYFVSTVSRLSLARALYLFWGLKLRRGREKLQRRVTVLTDENTCSWEHDTKIGQLSNVEISRERFSGRRHGHELWRRLDAPS